MANTIIPIYTSNGDAEAFLSYPYIFNRSGEWIGFITEKKVVYSILGYYVGMLTNDPRIIRKKSGETLPPIKPLQAPQNIRIAATIPLPRMMGELSHEVIDVLQDEPERLHTIDAGELRPDLD